MPRMQEAPRAVSSAVTYAHLWMEGQWLHDATVRIGAAGEVLAVTAAGAAGAAGATGAAGAAPHVAGLTLPGLIDAHCHAFQRVLGAWTQRAAHQRDDFWTWREPMYALAGRLRAADLEAISARCYLDLLRGGYTGVAEFLYLHRLEAAHEAAPDADLPIAAAARRTGIGLTLLPTLYQQADFGGVPPLPGQQPFVRDTARFLADWRELRTRYPAGGPVALGAAFHSLRAVDIEVIGRVQAALRADALCRCLHIHVAEQPAEVASCMRHYGLGPVALLATRGLLSSQWALIHGTHASDSELTQLRAAQATLVLCPTTEADLGDGCPPLAPYLDAGGQIAIGSDSNIARSALNELRQLEWSQRLARGRRNVLASAQEPAVADRLYRAALRGGRQAVGARAASGAAPGIGQRADFVTYETDAGEWAQQDPGDYLSALTFEAAAPRARQVMIGGRWVIRDGVHPEAARIDAEYRATLTRLRRT
jgi:formimidoylglutamate deiminase